MSCFCALLALCHPRNAKHKAELYPSLDGSYEIQAPGPLTDDAPLVSDNATQSPNSFPVSKLTATPEAISKPLHKQHISATLSPRALGALLKGVDFAYGGDERLPLHTFSADWDDNGGAEPAGDVQYEFIYEGEFGITWPLRKIRVDDLPVDESDEDVGDATDHTSAIMDVYEVEVTNRHDSKADVASEDMTSQTYSTPRKYRVRIRTATDATAPRFKVRVRAPEELGNLSMRRLPRRRGGLVLEMIKAAMDEDAQRGIANGGDGDASTVLEQVRKDSAGVQGQTQS